MAKRKSSPKETAGVDETGTPDDVERPKSGPADFVESFKVFLRNPETPTFESAAQAIQRWQAARRKYLRETAEDRRYSKTQTEEMLENDDVFWLVEQPAFRAQLKQAFEDFSQNPRISQPSKRQPGKR
jgi:hypothetical protein